MTIFISTNVYAIERSTNYDFTALQMGVWSYVMKLLTAVALVAMVAGCSMLPTRDTSGSSGTTSSSNTSQSSVKQGPYWAGCYFYPGCKDVQ
ncbi:MAG: hypothetical protein WBG17_03580 [Burkholderiaceae bacterium]